MQKTDPAAPQGLTSQNHFDIEQGLLGWHILNCVRSPRARLILDEIDKAVEQNTLADPVSGKANSKDRLTSDPKSIASRRRSLEALLEGFSEQPALGDALEDNVCFAAKEFGLDQIEAEMLTLILRADTYQALDRFIEEIREPLNSASVVMGCLLGRDSREVHKRIMPNAPLLERGLVVLEQSARTVFGHAGFIRLAGSLSRVMKRPHTDHVAWAQAIKGSPLQSRLRLEDFRHVGAAVDLAVGVLRGAGKGKAAGVNILLHGPVGTGKTELAKVLAAASGGAVWSICEEDEDGAEPNRFERIASLKLTQRLLGVCENSIVLVDEADDLLASPQAFEIRCRGSFKVYLNRQLESAVRPTIWTCNGLDEIDPAVLRRMTLAIEVKRPSASLREAMWSQAAEAMKVPLDPEAPKRLAAAWAAPPAVIASAMRAAALCGGGENEAALATSGVMRALGAVSINPSSNAVFNPALVSCELDLLSLADRLCASNGPKAWSACLSGPAGTGKSQYARYLANRLGMSVLEKRCSDILSKWVGDTEKSIALAFEEARDERAFLIFDEADSFLRSREHARAGWEVTQVNEMLTWMERHPLPFICTTNLSDRIDVAALRRFTFKLRFNALEPFRAAQAFRHFFGLGTNVPMPDGLTVGDFALVAKRREIYPEAGAEEIVVWLRDEVTSRGDRPSPIGFARNA